MKRLILLVTVLALNAGPTEAAPPRFAYQELPTLAGGPDKPRAICTVGVNETITIGSNQTKSVGTDRVVAWECSGANCTLVPLEPTAPSAATALVCGSSITTCIAVGWLEDAAGQHQPVAWSRGTEGDLDQMCLAAGTSSAAINQIETAAQVVRSISATSMRRPPGA